MKDKLTHEFIPNSATENVRAMLDSVGATDVEEFYRDIPDRLKLRAPLKIPDRMSELDVRRHVEAILSKNKSISEFLVFLGCGCWPHYVPSAVREIAGRSEFLTSYTPYQPETVSARCCRKYLKVFSPPSSSIRA